MNVKKAVFQGMVEDQGESYALISVEVEQGEHPLYQLYVDRALNGQYRIHRLFRNDANPELDWYNNDMHHAYEDVTSQVTQSSQQAAGGAHQGLGMGVEDLGVNQGMQRDEVPASHKEQQWLEQVLAYGDIREQLDARPFKP
ncbi:hypothetical protein [Marinicrinis sediminis]|uniref:Uncharacterized protein n=1 Tax=Marinicrinis sediminis TaxID=1652465 RepID=A0ABW5R8U3_9BACL